MSWGYACVFHYSAKKLFMSWSKTTLWLTRIEGFLKVVFSTVFTVLSLLFLFQEPQPTQSFVSKDQGAQVSSSVAQAATPQQHSVPGRKCVTGVWNTGPQLAGRCSFAGLSSLCAGSYALLEIGLSAVEQRDALLSTVFLSHCDRK